MVLLYRYGTYTVNLQTCDLCTHKHTNKETNYIFWTCAAISHMISTFDTGSQTIIEGKDDAYVMYDTRWYLTAMIDKMFYGAFWCLFLDCYYDATPNHCN